MVNDMGKCCECGEKIEYNQFRRVNGKIYCLKCTPEKELDLDEMKLLAEVEKEAAEQFDKTMAEHGETKVVESFNAFESAMKEVSDLDIKNKIAEEEELEKKKISEKLADTVVDSKVNLGELADALGTVNKKTATRKFKKRSKK